MIPVDFRVWDYREKCMRRNALIFLSQDAIAGSPTNTSTGEHYIRELKMDKVYGSPHPGHLYHGELMWSTGCKDREDKTIYDRDLVSWSPYRPEEEHWKNLDIVSILQVPSIGEVFWAEGAAGFLVAEIFLGIEKEVCLVRGEEVEYTFRSRFYDHDGQQFSWSELKVIGNVFENPELLADAEEQQRQQEGRR